MIAPVKSSIHWFRHYQAWPVDALIEEHAWLTLNNRHLLQQTTFNKLMAVERLLKIAGVKS